MSRSSRGKSHFTFSPLMYIATREATHQQVLTSAQCNLHCFLFTKSIFTIIFLLLCAGVKARNKMAMSWMIVVLCTRGICWWWANAILSISFLISANKRRGLHFTSRDILDAAMRPMIQLYHWSYHLWTFIWISWKHSKKRHDMTIRNEIILMFCIEIRES